LNTAKEVQNGGLGFVVMEFWRFPIPAKQDGNAGCTTTLTDQNDGEDKPVI